MYFDKRVHENLSKEYPFLKDIDFHYNSRFEFQKYLPLKTFKFLHLDYGVCDNRSTSDYINGYTRVFYSIKSDPGKYKEVVIDEGETYWSSILPDDVDIVITEYTFKDMMKIREEVTGEYIYNLFKNVDLDILTELVNLDIRTASSISPKDHINDGYSFPEYSNMGFINDAILYCLREFHNGNDYIQVENLFPSTTDKEFKRYFYSRFNDIFKFFKEGFDLSNKKDIISDLICTRIREYINNTERFMILVDEYFKESRSISGMVRGI